jgi:hypothetical protein
MAPNGSMILLALVVDEMESRVEMSQLRNSEDASELVRSKSQ